MGTNLHQWVKRDIDSLELISDRIEESADCIVNAIHTLSLRTQMTMRVNLLYAIATDDDARCAIIALYWIETIVADDHFDAPHVSLSLKKIEQTSIATTALGRANKLGVDHLFRAVTAPVDGTNAHWRRERLHEIEILYMHMGMPPASPTQAGNTP
ncbi:MAG TPA: hypothetical protein VN289_22755 [Paraburkholderia sp.]|jgi:hypothetical protein|nr:hypothetical protein [Paraburkholderia sp.]